MTETRTEWKKKPLLERLKGFDYNALDHICCEAAERIEELESSIETLKSVRMDRDITIGLQMKEIEKLEKKVKRQMEIYHNQRKSIEELLKELETSQNEIYDLGGRRAERQLRDGRPE